MTFDDRKDAAAVFILRIGLAWFIFLWAAHKIITPGQYQGLVRNYEGIEISFAQIYATAGFQIALCVLTAIGALRLMSYSGLAVMHFFTVTRRWDGFFDPFALNERGFPINRNQVIDLAVLAAFVALILLINRDHFSVGGWLRKRMGRRVWWQ
ncbi:hypothetical protein FHS72_000965 [Loktanella ponticola]|uniref:DoxX family protein n=1 Tax=Yoonia ponticola TaxID=1524255 RepID=A0A7W9EX66_9RHOB|nr:hypothetical protein [Yoonia ponticola]MBB5721358.1 hypothetical protein [Yoonia ponticola]